MNAQATNKLPLEEVAQQQMIDHRSWSLVQHLSYLQIEDTLQVESE